MLINEQLQIFDNPITALRDEFKDDNEFLEFVIDHNYIQTKTTWQGCCFISTINLDDDNLYWFKEECYSRNIMDMERMEELDEVCEQYLFLKEYNANTTLD